MNILKALLADLRRLLTRLLTVVRRPMSAVFVPNPRRTLVMLSYWAHAHRGLWDYDQARPVRYGLRPRFKKDCSGGIAWLYWCAGLNDPTRNAFSGGDTYTGSLLYHGQRIQASQVRAGDVCVFGAELPTEMQHAMMALQRGPNPLSFSHGRQGDPSLIRPSVDSRSKTWLRFDLRRVRRIQWPGV